MHFLQAFRTLKQDCVIGYLCLSCSILVFSCHPKQAEYPYQPETYTLTGDTICNYPYYIPGPILLSNGYLVMIDPQNAGSMHICNTRTQQTNHYSYKNNLDKADPAIFPLSFFQFDMSSYYWYTLKDGEVKLSRLNLNLKNRSIYNGLPISKKTFLLLGFFRNGLLGLYDEDSRKLDCYGHTPIQANYINFYGNIALSEDQSKIAYVSTIDFAYVACYHLTGRKLNFQWEQFIVPPPSWSMTAYGYMKSNETLPRGSFKGIEISGDYIFASYSEFNQVDSYVPDHNSIRIYRMDGVLKAICLTEYPIYQIIVNSQEKCIYGLAYEEKPVIVRFPFSF